jgi:hypothetical protein
VTDALTFAPGCSALAPLETVRDLITARYDLLITCLTPIVHSSGNMGNDSIFMREKVANPDEPGSFPDEVPCLTGNSLRHALREALTWLTLREIGLEIGGLSVAAQHFLLSGGSMGKGASTLDVEGFRELKERFPYLALFGGGLGTSLITGKLHVGPGVLVCRQNAWRLADLCPVLADDARQAHPAEEYTERGQGTRHDARRSPVAEHLMPAADAEAWSRERMKSAKENADEGSDSTQMIYGYEKICAGSRFLWQVGGAHLTPLEHSALICALLALQHRGELGAKTGTGHGRVRLRAISASGEDTPLTDGLRFVEQGERLSDILGQAWGGAYVAHVREHAAGIKEWLGGLK